ncbi:MAG: hypothetical protein SX243_06565 [Acidobacteriota bacterium]|nr:hypothetical protein [Acidobacteriota bacterium]
MSKVLWVDDDADGSLLGLGRILERAGLEVDIAADVSTALNLLEENDYDSILLDLLVPQFNSSRGLDPLPGLRVVDFLSKRTVRNRDRNTPKVVILTVMSPSELEPELRGKDVQIFSKMAILEREVMEDLKAALKAKS